MILDISKFANMRRCDLFSSKSNDLSWNKPHGRWFLHVVDTRLATGDTVHDILTRVASSHIAFRYVLRRNCRLAHVAPPASYRATGNTTTATVWL